MTSLQHHAEAPSQGFRCMAVVTTQWNAPLWTGRDVYEGASLDEKPSA